jgi:predicted RNA-binding Zn ribbon-like protein
MVVSVAARELPRQDAPDAVAVVRDFVNTTDHETGTDEIATAAALTRYLRSAGLSSGLTRAASPDLDQAHALRAGLRRALELNHTRQQASLPRLAAELRRLPVGLDWDVAGATLRPTAGGIQGALARIGLAAHECAVTGTWSRLKVCASDDCEWAYFDHSKNQSRNWCDYGCGNRIKTRAYRDRQRSR